MTFKNGMKFLFIGNSATYVHEVPQTLQKLAGELGFEFEVAQITPGGCELAMHANTETDLGKQVFAEIAKGYDVVFLQENGSCMSSEEKFAACSDACRRLIAAIRESGAEPTIYVRPPCLKDYYGYPTIEQCKNFDKIFNKIAEDNGGVSRVYVNRSFAYAAKNYNFSLWGPDNGHTSPLGAYLIVCTFFATLFGESATKLSTLDLDPTEAKTVAEIADKVLRESIEP